MVLNSADFLDDDAALEAFILSTAADSQRNQDPEFSVDESAEGGGAECQLCNAPLGDLSTTARQAHYEQHFDNDGAEDELEGLYDFDQELQQPVAGPSGSNSISNEGSSSDDAMGNSSFLESVRRMSRSSFGLGGSETVDPAQNVFWHAGLDTQPPHNFTAGLIPLLKTALEKTHAKSTTRQAFLCNEVTCHVATERWDFGWGCGYRNFLMACTALTAQTEQPEYAALLSSPISPGVRNLQKWIQQAWDDGFDAEGRSQLKRVVGTRRWIGTGELYTAFVHRGIPARLVDFPTGNPKLVLDWVRDYFDERKKVTNAFDALRSGGSAIVLTNRMPLILQHAGHSRTIIGIEIDRAGAMNLLLFDPSRRPARNVRDAALAAHLKIQLPEKKKKGIAERFLHPHSGNAKRSRHGDEKGLDMSVVSAKLVNSGDEAHQPAHKKARTDKDSSHRSSDENTAVEGTGPQTHTRAASLALHETHLDPLKLVKLFRLNSAKLGKNDKYQILWFPMTAPYDDAARFAHREVTSEQVR